MTIIRLFLLAVSFFLSTISLAAEQPIALVGGMLLDGYEASPQQQSVVIVEGNVIVATGTIEDTPIPDNAYVIDTSGKTVMPGLIDLHGHMIIIGHGDYKSYVKFLGPERIPEAYKISAKQLLRAGVTTFVDLGSTDSILDVKKQIDAGDIPGPRVIASGPWIARVDVPIFFKGTGYVINSPKEAARKTIELINKGFDVIKLWEGLTQEDFNAVVREAHKRGVQVHAHVYTPKEIERALNAGVDVLQHAGSAKNPPYSKELISRIAHSATPVVQTISHRIWIYPDTVAFPTRLQDSRLKEDLPNDLYGELQRSFKNFHRLDYFRHVEEEIRNAEIAARQFIDAGAIIGVGTDAASPMNFHTEAMWREMEALVEFGMTPIQVISAATKRNAEILGHIAKSRADGSIIRLFNKARVVGTIEPGMLADMIVVDGDPRKSMQLLNKPDLVIKDGVPWFTKQNVTPLLKAIGRQF